MSDSARPKSSGNKLSAEEINQDLPVEMTSGEAINCSSNPQAIYIKDSDGKVYKTDADYDDERMHNFVGFARDSAAGADETITVQTKGIVGGFSGLDAGKVYYLSNTPGAISTSPGTYKKAIGIAISSTELLLYKIPSFRNYAEVTGSRALDGIYQNTTGRWLFVMVTVKTTVGTGSRYVDAQIGSGSPPITIVQSAGGSSGSQATPEAYWSMSFFVPNNYYYRILKSSASISLAEWWEIELL